MADSASSTEERMVKGLVLGPVLGKGTFGVVRLGTKKETGHQFALKFLKRDSKNFREDEVKKEIDCMKKIRHPHVVALLASTMKCKYPLGDGKFELNVLMVMEYANGGDLYDVIYYAGAFDEELGRTYFLQLLNGLQAIHDAGITHRDLKPNNILIDHKYMLKITDFGLSHIGADNVDPNQKRMKTSWVGTRGYRAPELVLKARYSNQCDVFALGVCLFVMLCARQPFKTASVEDPWYKCIATKQFPRYWKSHKSANLSDDAKTFLQELLCYQPRERLTIENAKKHAWMKKSIIETSKLEGKMKALHIESNKKKLADPDRAQRLQSSPAAGNKKRANDNPWMNHKPCKVDKIGFGETAWILKTDDKKATLPNIMDNVLGYCETNLQANVKRKENFTALGTRTTAVTDPNTGKQKNLTQDFILRIVQIKSQEKIEVMTLSFGTRQIVGGDALKAARQTEMIVLDALKKEDYVAQVLGDTTLTPVKDTEGFDFSAFEEEVEAV